MALRIPFHTSRRVVWTLAGAIALVSASTLETAGAVGSETVEALIKRKTQQFSDAGLTGDRAELDRDLAPDVAFTNEDGSTPSKAEILRDAAPSRATNPKLEVTEFKARVHGPIAVATFVDVLTYVANGQPQLYRFRSTEVWRRDPEGWRIIASQTLSVEVDPPAVALPSDTLADYAGDYRAGSDLVVRIAPGADGIISSAPGGAPVVFKPELRDVFFLPGQPHLRRIFQRDAQGHVTGYINRFGGHDVWVPKV